MMAMNPLRKAFLLAAVSLLFITGCSSPATNAEKAPEFTLSDNFGHQVSLADYRGQKAVLLLFSNYKSGGGQDPLLLSSFERYDGVDGLEHLQVQDLSSAPPAVVDSMKQFRGQMLERGHAPPLVDADGNVSRSYRANPEKLTLILIDQAGIVRYREEGPPPAKDNDVIAQKVAEVTR